MDDLFSSAALFLPAIDKNSDPARVLLVEEVEKLLKSSPFLSVGEKEKMLKVIPIFTNPILQDFKESLIRENLRELERKMDEHKSK